jgi:hypothetical protein
MNTLLFLVVLQASLALLVESKVALITGATGRTGSDVYGQLKKHGFTVRALVRNATKARERLNCSSCDASDGIFVGDITKPETLSAAMQGVDTLVITTGPAYHCKIPSIFIGCKYYPGADPKAMAWLGVKNTVSAFAAATGPALESRHAILLSNDLTTVPNNTLDKIDNGFGTFYALQGEVFTMSSGVPFTIIKPNGLNDGEPEQKELIVAHDDQGWGLTNLNTAFIHRSDVTRMLTYAAINRDKSVGLRFDVTSKLIGGSPTKDLAPLFKETLYPWDPRKQASEAMQ